MLTYDIADHIIERQIIAHFPEACMSGEMPGGFKSKFPLIPGEVFVEKWVQNYSEWATGANKNAIGSCGKRIAVVLGSCEDSSHLGLLPRRADFMKSRVSYMNWDSVKLAKSE